MHINSIFATSVSLNVWILIQQVSEIYRKQSFSMIMLCCEQATDQ